MPFTSALRINLVFAAVFAMLSVASNAYAQAAVNACGPLQRAAGGYGPYDYRTQREKMRIVEPYHFTPQVEALIRGQSGHIGGDLSYLMRTSPNHHRGLMAIMRFVEKTKSSQPPHMQYSIDCYFDRAIRFAPDDTIVRVLYAQYLQTTGDRKKAEEQLRVATVHAGDNPISHFNIGLAAQELGSHELALEQAHRAQAMGFTRPELEQRLRANGHWRDPKP